MKKLLVFVLMFGVCSVGYACGSFDECMDEISDTRGLSYSAVEAYSAKAQAYAIKELVDYIKMDNSQTCYELDINDNWIKMGCK